MADPEEGRSSPPPQRPTQGPFPTPLPSTEQPSEQTPSSSKAAPSNTNAEQVGDSGTQKQISQLQAGAKSAENWMTWLTAAIALFALCSSVVAFLQWNAMRGQLEEMKNSSADTRELARAATRQAAASEEANRNALSAERPWIGVMMGVDSFEVDRTPTITIVYVNTGRRPAKVTLTEYRWATYAVFPDNPEYPEPGTAKSTNIVVPNGRSDVTITVDKLTESQMSVWRSRSRSFYVHTNIEYEDPVTNARHWTHACWQFIWFEKGIRSGFYNCPKYNEAH